jgi:ferric-dicitrate binding protein FerR (iron transport regulator)
MDKEKVISLLKRHAEGRLTDIERNELFTFLDNKQHKETVIGSLEYLLAEGARVADFDEKRFGSLLVGILKADEISDADEGGRHNSGRRGSRQKSVKKTLWVLIGLFILAAGVYFLLIKPATEKRLKINQSNYLKHDVFPGGYKAMLTLSDGSSLSLDSIVTGVVSQQGNVKVTKTTKKELTYNASGKRNTVVIFNTLTTPAGGEYKVVLSDGSTVRLNAFSSITYPVIFDKERIVTITGEAYFEIANNGNTPFKVKVFDMEVEGTGMHVNINAYTDEPVIETTVIKGIAKLNKGSATKLLRPAQKGLYDNEGKFSLIKNADTNEVIAWKNGFFQFNNTKLKNVMRQLGRWYDVDIVYEDSLKPEKEIFGEIRRSVNLSDVISALNKSEVNCRVDGRKLIVMH